MKLKKLQLENFRNYHRYEYIFDPDKNATVITGPNGKGKTNLLEAIHVMSLGKSFRSVLQDDLIEWEMDYFRCRADIEANGEAMTLEVGYSNYPSKKKVFKVNGAAVKNSEYVGTFTSVLFNPEDLNILYLSPSLRRKYIDILLSQSEKKYLQSLLKYNKSLKQRNALLHDIREQKFQGRDTKPMIDNLYAWDKEVSQFGEVLIEKRQDFTEFLNKKLTKIYQSISGDKENIHVTYVTKIANNYLQTLSERLEKDILQGRSTAGPHRDDLQFFINDKEINKTASRGEFRTLLLSIKLAEIDYLKEKTGENPILILDDVFSELDTARQTQLLKAIENCQAIISTTDLSNLQEMASESAILQLADTQ